MSNESIPQTAQEQSSHKAGASTAPNASRQLAAFLAAGVAIAFFLPWINILGIKPSGFDLVRKLNGLGLLLWAMPLFGGMTLLASFTTAKIRSGASITAVVPFIILAFGIYRESPDLIKVLDIGAYIGLLLAAGLMIVAARMKS